MIDKSLIDQNVEEHYVKKGDPNKPTYHIIRPPYTVSGLFFNVVITLGHIRYALSKEQFPVVDWQNYPNAYLEPEKLGKENSWEYYFEQPLRIGLEEAYNGENIVLSSKKNPPLFPGSNISFEEKDSMLTKWRMLIKKGLLTVKSDIMRKILSIREKLFLQNDRVLGVKLRGTDYVTNKPKWHYIPPPHIISHRYCSY